MHNRKYESKKVVLSPRQPPPYSSKLPKIPYYCDSELDNMKTSSTRRTVSYLIKVIFRQIERYTCLKFERNKTDQVKNSIGINFLLSNNSNNTVSLSNSSNCPTNVTLTNGTYMNTTLLSFYIGIALDIIPEVRRPDRDIDVNVTMDNVGEEFVQYYNKTNSSYITYLNDTEFDFRSPMFLGPDFGSKNNKSTYEVLLYKEDQYPFGRGRVFRHNFYKYIFYYYCNGSTIQNKCKYGGYSYPSNKCKCPEHLSGNFCTEFKNDSVIFTNYTKPVFLKANFTRKHYSVNLTNTIFYLNITSEHGYNVNATIKKITFSKTNCSSFGSSLEVLIRKDKGAAGIYLCRNSTNSKLPSLSNEVFFILDAKNENIFFNVTYRAVSRNKTRGKFEKALKNQTKLS
uniref:Astacin domain-containing protein n=1 Tax=Strongyloides papillosus TaxID=174720 RepID=A0A0N5CC20_STREA